VDIILEHSATQEHETSQ